MTEDRAANVVATPPDAAVTNTVGADDPDVSTRHDMTTLLTKQEGEHG
jgi:hypothetical protein